MKTTQHKSILQMALCSILWSISGLLIKLIPWNGIVIAGVRSLIAVGVFVVFMKTTHRRFEWSKGALRLSLLIPAMCFCFIMANKLTTAANAIVLQYTAPVFLLLYEFVFRRKKFRVGDYITVLFTMGGVTLFFLDQLEGGAMVGNMLAILAGAFFAGTMFSVEGISENSRLTGLASGHLLTAVIGVPFAFVYDTPITIVPVVAMLVLGIFQLGIPYILYGLAATHCTPLTLTLLAALEPVLNPVWVFLFVGEAPGRTALFGGALVIISITLWCIWDAKQKHAGAIAESKDISA